MRKSFVIYLVLCTSLYAKAQYVSVDTTKLAQAYAAWQHMAAGELTSQPTGLFRCLPQKLDGVHRDLSIRSTFL